MCLHKRALAPQLWRQSCATCCVRQASFHVSLGFAAWLLALNFYSSATRPGSSSTCSQMSSRRYEGSVCGMYAKSALCASRTGLIHDPRTGATPNPEFRVRARDRTYDVEGAGTHMQHGITNRCGSQVRPASFLHALMS